MKNTVIASLIVFCLTAPLLFGQSPPNPLSPEELVRHHLKFLTTVLSLTAVQQQQAATIFNGAAKDDSSLHMRLMTAHDHLATAVKGNDWRWNRGGF